MTDQFITVVFKCGHNSKLRKSITESFKNDRAFGDAEITAVSLEDEISKVEKYE